VASYDYRCANDDNDPHCRCHMHGLNLGLQSIAAHPWARKVVSSAQKIVTFVRASPKAWAAVVAAITEGTVLKLLSSNATRFTSVIIMLRSLKRLREALLRVAEEQPSIFKPEILKIIRDRDFWMDLRALLPVLEPFEKAITQVQSNDCTLGDVLLHWLRVGAVIKKEYTSLPRGMAKPHEEGVT